MASTVSSSLCSRWYAVWIRNLQLARLGADGAPLEVTVGCKMYRARGGNRIRTEAGVTTQMPQVE